MLSSLPLHMTAAATPAKPAGMTADPLPHQTPAWGALAVLARAGTPQLPALFLAEPERLAGMTIDEGGLHFDFSKLPLSVPHFTALAELARVAGLNGWRARLAAGEVVNGSEDRAATHMQLRDPAGRGLHRPMRRLVEQLRGGTFGVVEHLIHIGIGGSALGPHLLLDALGGQGDGPDVHVVANIDGVALARAIAACNPATTMIVAVSKTFTTQETLTNLQSALAWLAASGVEDGWGRVIAVTAAPERAAAVGVSGDRILGFSETIGGRYSVWSAVGLPLALRCGWASFEALLDGAHAMDRHFLSAGLLRNAPVVAAMADVWAACFTHKATRAVFAYDERLRLLPAYLQQLEMESNGKSVSRDGRPLPFATAAITWGGTGTDAQHAVFQLLHQGTHSDPVEFLAVATPGHALAAAHHKLLLANCFAQSAALMRGRTAAETLAEAKGDPALAGARSFPGNRGSSTVLIDRLTPDRMGALLAYYEARTFCAAVLMGLNPFDQWGVELGKATANALSSGDDGGFDASTANLVQVAARMANGFG